MAKRYKSEFYKKQIEIIDFEGEKFVFITSDSGKKVIYSGYNLEKQNTQITYITKCLLGGFIKKIPKSVLVLGLGGGSFVKYLEDHISGIEIVGVDIDEAMIEIAKKEFGVKTQNLICADAKLALLELAREKKIFDLILIDCYGIDSEIPGDLTSLEFFENCKNILSLDGTISINMANFSNNEKPEDIARLNKYIEMHENLKSVFGNYFSMLTSLENNPENAMLIYNLAKYYKASEFNKNYLEKVKLGEIKYDENMTLDTFVDENREFLK